MKTRKGFVSNSSSSTFLVYFKEKPKTLEECRKILFENRTVGFFCNANNSEASITRDTQRIFNDIKNQNPLSETQIKEEFCSGYPCSMGYEDWSKDINPEPIAENFKIFSD